MYNGGPKALSLWWATSGLVFCIELFLSIFGLMVLSCQKWRNGCRIMASILHNTCLRDKTIRHWPNKHKNLVVMASCMAFFSATSHLFSCLALHHKAIWFYRGTWWRRVWLSWVIGGFAFDTCPLYQIRIGRSDENNWNRFCVDPPTPSNADCLHLVDSGRWIGRSPRLKSLLITQTANANSDSHRLTHRSSSGGCMEMRGLSGSYTTCRPKNFGLWSAPCENWWRETMVSGIYLVSSRLRPAMCCSKDLTPKPLPFLLLRAPSSLSAADTSCFSFQSWGEPGLLLSDLYYSHSENKNENHKNL